jgi:hypothetical protein
VAACFTLDTRSVDCCFKTRDPWNIGVPREIVEQIHKGIEILKYRKEFQISLEIFGICFCPAFGSTGG